jgi:hypothetical protein
MKQLICILLLCIISCTHEKKGIKTTITTIYEAELVGSNYVKKNMTTKYSIGRYPSGKQKFFVGLYGYQNNDTTFYEEANNKEVKEGEFTFLYRNDSLTLVTRKSKDTLFYYSPIYLDDFTSYDIYNKENNLIKSFDALMYKEVEYKNYFFDEYGNPTYYVEIEEKLPNLILEKNLSPAEAAKNKIEGRKIRIVEQEFNYYE